MSRNPPLHILAVPRYGGRKLIKFYAKRNARIRRLFGCTYREYLASDRWKIIRQFVLSRDCGKCCICHRAANQVHHTNYKSSTLTGHCVGALFSICGECHKWIEFNKSGEKLNQQHVRKAVRHRCAILGTKYKDPAAKGANLRGPFWKPCEKRAVTRKYPLNGIEPHYHDAPREELVVAIDASEMRNSRKNSRG